MPISAVHWFVLFLSRGVGSDTLRSYHKRISVRPAVLGYAAVVLWHCSDAMVLGNVIKLK